MKPRGIPVFELGSQERTVRHSEILGQIAPGTPRPVLYSLWQETLDILATRNRQDLTAGIRTFIPVIARLGGREAIVETFYAIQDVGRWWP